MSVPPFALLPSYWARPELDEFDVFADLIAEETLSAATAKKENQTADLRGSPSAQDPAIPTLPWMQNVNVMGSDGTMQTARIALGPPPWQPGSGSGARPVDVTSALIPPAPLPEGLVLLSWKEHQSAGTASLLVLFALAVIRNRRQRNEGRNKTNAVTATYEHIQEMVPISRKLVAAGLKLLEQAKAIVKLKDGRKNRYALLGLETPGKYCKFPQHHMMNGTSFLQRLNLFVEQIRRRTSLLALKVYMLLLAQRTNRTNLAIISYERIMTYTGLRREDVRPALDLLTAAQLIRIAVDAETTQKKSDRKPNQYVLYGLTAS